MHMHHILPWSLIFTIKEVFFWLSTEGERIPTWYVLIQGPISGQIVKTVYGYIKSGLHCRRKQIKEVALGYLYSQNFYAHSKSLKPQGACTLLLFLLMKNVLRHGREKKQGVTSNKLYCTQSVLQFSPPHGPPTWNWLKLCQWTRNNSEHLV